MLALKSQGCIHVLLYPREDYQPFLEPQSAIKTK